MQQLNWRAAFFVDAHSFLEAIDRLKSELFENYSTPDT